MPLCLEVLLDTFRFLIERCPSWTAHVEERIPLAILQAWQSCCAHCFFFRQSGTGVQALRLKALLSSCKLLDGRNASQCLSYKLRLNGAFRMARLKEASRNRVNDA